MTVILVLAAAAAAIYGLHLLALWAESRGWIFYRHRKPHSSSLGNAFLEVQSLIEPQKRPLVALRTAEAVEEDETGEPPDPGGDDDRRTAVR